MRRGRHRLRGRAARGEVPIHVNSLFGYETRLPLVEFTVGTERVQILPDDARLISRWIDECAESAETDAFLWEHFTALGLAPEQVGHVLVAFRHFRERKRGEEGTEPE